MSMNDEKSFRESLAKLLENSILISYGYTVEEGKYTTIQLQFETRQDSGEASSGGMVSRENLEPETSPVRHETLPEMPQTGPIGKIYYGPPETVEKPGTEWKVGEAVCFEGKILTIQGADALFEFTDPDRPKALLKPIPRIKVPLAALQEKK